jgi:hypothetical protein
MTEKNSFFFCDCALLTLHSAKGSAVLNTQLKEWTYRGGAKLKKIV